VKVECHELRSGIDRYDMQAEIMSKCRPKVEEQTVGCSRRDTKNRTREKPVVLRG
jgi:hypothetical protein